jgi:hypothetical protein
MSHDGCLHKGSAYFFGGYNTSMSDSNLVVRFELATEKWQNFKASVPPRCSHTLTSCDKGIFLCFGAKAKKPLDDIWHYKPLANFWEEVKVKGAKPPKLMGHTCVAVGAKLYSFGGRVKNGKVTNDLVISDTSTLAAAPTPTPAPAPAASAPATAKPAPKIAPATLGATRDGNATADLGIDLSKLAPMEQVSLRMKVKRVIQVRTENSRLETRLFNLEVKAGVASATLPNEPLLVKVLNPPAPRAPGDLPQRSFRDDSLPIGVTKSSEVFGGICRGSEKVDYSAHAESASLIPTLIVLLRNLPTVVVYSIGVLPCG